MNNDSSLTGWISTLANGATGVIGALNSGNNNNSTQAAATAAAQAQSSTWQTVAKYAFWGLLTVFFLGLAVFALKKAR